MHHVGAMSAICSHCAFLEQNHHLTTIFKSHARVENFLLPWLSHRAYELTSDYHVNPLPDALDMQGLGSDCRMPQLQHQNAYPSGSRAVSGPGHAKSHSIGGGASDTHVNGRVYVNCMGRSKFVL